jgi:hypothetical protein
VLAAHVPQANDGGSFGPSRGGEYPGFPLINPVDLLNNSTDNEGTPTQKHPPGDAP